MKASLKTVNLTKVPTHTKKTPSVRKTEKLIDELKGKLANCAQILKRKNYPVLNTEVIFRQDKRYRGINVFIEFDIQRNEQFLPSLPYSWNVDTSSHALRIKTSFYCYSRADMEAYCMCPIERLRNWAKKLPQLHEAVFEGTKICNSCHQVYESNFIHEYAPCPNCLGQVLFVDSSEYRNTLTDYSAQKAFYNKIAHFGSPNISRIVEIKIGFHSKNDSADFRKSLCAILGLRRQKKFLCEDSLEVEFTRWLDIDELKPVLDKILRSAISLNAIRSDDWFTITV